MYGHRRRCSRFAGSWSPLTMIRLHPLRLTAAIYSPSDSNRLAKAQICRSTAILDSYLLGEANGAQPRRCIISARLPNDSPRRKRESWAGLESALCCCVCVSPIPPHRAQHWRFYERKSYETNIGCYSAQDCQIARHNGAHLVLRKWPCAGNQRFC